MVTRILIIEDNRLNMELLVQTVRAFGYEPLPAYSGAAGLEMARSQRPEIIVCDIHLPDMDGLAIARTLKADPDLRAIPLVGASAYAMPEDHDLAYAAGFDAYLTKPIDFNKLLKTLRTLVKSEHLDER